MEQGVIMEITRDDIKNTIQKMVIAGKTLPQKDRIRCAKDQDAEQQKVITETVDLWWGLFKDRHIGVERWEQASNKALMLAGIARLDTSIINPGMMSYAVELVEKEHLERMQAEAQKHKQEDKEGLAPVNFPEMGRLVAYHMRRHKRPLLSLPGSEAVYKAIGGRMSEDKIKDNMLCLRVYLCYWEHSRRDKENLPVKLVDRGEGRLGIDFVN